MPSFVLLVVEETNVFLTTIEVEAANRLPIVVIQQDTEIALRIPVNDSFRINNRPDNKKSPSLRGFFIFEG